MFELLFTNGDAVETCTHIGWHGRSGRHRLACIFYLWRQAGIHKPDEIPSFLGNKMNHTKFPKYIFSIQKNMNSKNLNFGYLKKICEFYLEFLKCSWIFKYRSFFHWPLATSNSQNDQKVTVFCQRCTRPVRTKLQTRIF